jgi:hypothetical protein
MRPTSLVQTSKHLLATECRQCRRSPAVNETFLQEICRNLTNRTDLSRWPSTTTLDKKCGVSGDPMPPRVRYGTIAAKVKLR